MWIGSGDSVFVRISFFFHLIWQCCASGVPTHPKENRHLRSARHVLRAAKGDTASLPYFPERKKTHQAFLPV